MKVVPGYVSSGRAISELLEAESALTTLDLSQNNLHNKTALQIAEKLGENKSLTWFSLADNNLGDVETRYIGQALLSHASLRTLDLSGNRIHSKGAAVIAYAAKQSTSALRFINLEGNPIGSLGGLYLFRAMREVAQQAYPLLHLSANAQHRESTSRSSSC